jgi:threonine/homoserine/homoserine lactone efflux protein
MKDGRSKVYGISCITMTFMFGIIVGALIHTDNSLWNVITSIGLATIVFHFTMLRNFGVDKLLKVIKKGH